ncbi:esterase-like activity of phytase family protein [Pseudaestuariivita sp.]|uniref:esterase-like activity of phytase family protein n=1 Tax=Pseudaestuariivita sp. TaxID=2211669 RepID=UPI004059B43D
MHERLAVALRRLIGCAALWLAGLASAANADDVPQARYLGSYSWDLDVYWFGGFSGLEVFDGGRRFVAITDRGIVTQGSFAREGGEIIGVTVSDAVLLFPAEPFRDAEVPRDSEGLARAPDGRLWVSFEGAHRVGRLEDGVETRALPGWEQFGDLSFNGGFEGLARVRGGFVAIPERSGSPIRPFPVWRFLEGSWTRIGTIPRREGFLPVGLDYLPDVGLFLLERAAPGFGFRSRVRLLSVEGDRVEVLGTVLTTRTRAHDNLEGLSVWRDAAGRIRLTMVSDDNFMPFQKTEFVEYVID